MKPNGIKENFTNLHSQNSLHPTEGNNWKVQDSRQDET